MSSFAQNIVDSTKNISLNEVVISANKFAENRGQCLTKIDYKYFIIYLMNNSARFLLRLRGRQIDEQGQYRY